MAAGSFRSDINGLRAVAVVIVVLYHLGVPGFHGGYVGVDVFFVISGFLMTQLVVGKLGKGSFSLVDFWAARVRRLMPALLVLCATLIAIGAFLLLPVAYRALAKSALATLSFTSNIVFWQERGYFDAPSQTKWLLHTWSLSVEWQFYLVYPLALAVVHRVLRGRFLGRVLCFSALASFILCVVATPLKPEASFYLLPTRTWELLVGGIVWTVLRRADLSVFGARAARPALAWVGLALIVVATLAYTEGLRYPGAYALLPVAGAALVVVARADVQPLRHPFAQLLGDTSYSLYLWHWPLIVAARVLHVPFTPLSMLALAALSLLAAVASHRFIELRFHAAPTRPRSIAPSSAASFALAARASSTSAGLLLRTAAVVAIVAAAAGGVLATRGLPARVPALVAENDAASAAFAWDETCAEKRACAVGAERARKVVFWGDSHVEQLLPAVQTLVEQGRTHDKQPLFFAHRACMPVRGFRDALAARDCPAWNDKAFARAQADDVDAVVLASIWTTYFRAILYDVSSRPTICSVDEGGRCTPLTTRDDALARVRRRMMSDVGALTAQHKRVFLVRPVPVFDRDVAAYMAERAWHGAAVDLHLTRARHEELIAPAAALLDDVARATGAVVIDPAEVLCASGDCTYEQRGVTIYRDNNHLATAGALLLTPSLAAVFE